MTRQPLDVSQAATRRRRRPGNPARWALVALLSAAAIASPRVARAVDDPGLLDPFTEHRNRGTQLFNLGSYEEAFKEFLSAYAVRKDRELLFDLGRTARELGRTRGALDYLQRYLIDEPSPPTARGAQAQRMVRSLITEQSRPAPAASPPPEGAPPPAALPALPALPGDLRLLPVRVEKRSNGALMGGGAMLLGLSYMAAFSTGVFIINNKYAYSAISPDGNLRSASGALMVPLVGAFVSGALYREASWWAPWVLLDGMAQLSGLILIIAGARDKHDVLVPTLWGNRVVISPWGGSQGGGLSVAGTF